jgi:hypothetical protein
VGPETSHPYIHPRDAPSTTHLDPHRHDSPKIFAPQNPHPKADLRGWGSPARRFHRTPGVHSTAMSVTTDRKKISGLSYDPSHEGRGASCACAYLVPSPASRGGLSLISHPRPFSATTCVDVQTKTSVAEQRSAGKPPDLGNADPVAAQLDLTRPFADQQNLQTSASRGTSSDRFRANFLRRCPVNIGLLGSERNLSPRKRYTNGCSC